MQQDDEQHASAVVEVQVATRSLLMFRLGEEWLALSTRSLVEVAPLQTVHSLPHQRSRALLGVANVRGARVACLSLVELLGLEASTATASGARVMPRMLIIAAQGGPVVVPVDEVDGIHAIDQRLLDAATTVIRAQGFAATTVDDICTAAGVSKGSFFHHFASKEALFEAALRQTLVATMESASGQVESFSGNTRELLTLFFGLVQSQLEESGAVVLMKVLIGEGHRFPALVELHREIALSRGAETLGRILRRGVERGNDGFGGEVVGHASITSTVTRSLVNTQTSAATAIARRAIFSGSVS